MFPDGTNWNDFKEENTHIVVSATLLKFVKELRYVDNEESRDILDKMVYSLIKSYKLFNMREALLHLEGMTDKSLDYKLMDRTALDSAVFERSPQKQNVP